MEAILYLLLAFVIVCGFAALMEKVLMMEIKEKKKAQIINIEVWKGKKRVG